MANKKSKQKGQPLDKFKWKPVEFQFPIYTPPVDERRRYLPSQVATVQRLSGNKKAVAKIQADLVNLGYLKGGIDGVWEKQTEAAWQAAMADGYENRNGVAVRTHKPVRKPATQDDKIKQVQQQLVKAGYLKGNNAVDGIWGKNTQAAYDKAKAAGLFDAKPKASKTTSLSEQITYPSNEFGPANEYITGALSRRFGTLRDHAQGALNNFLQYIGVDVPTITRTEKDYGDTFNKNGKAVATQALGRFRGQWGSLKEGESSLMRDTSRGAKDGGLTGRDFKAYNKRNGGGYARSDWKRYFSAATGGDYSFEYGPGGANLEVTNIGPDSLQVRVFDDNNFDNSSLSDEERKNVGNLRLIMGKLIGTGGKKIKRNLTYKIAKKDVPNGND